MATHYSLILNHACLKARKCGPIVIARTVIIILKEVRTTGRKTAVTSLLFAYGTLMPADPVAAARQGWRRDAVRGRLYDLGPYLALIDLRVSLSS
jgi:hypothetical protein